MSKERLEELLDDLPYTIRHSGELEPLKQFARERAERVQELKEENISLKAIKAGNEELIKMLEQQNKRYREALEEIVHQENLKETNVFGYDHEDISSYVEEVARQALKGESE